MIVNLDQARDYLTRAEDRFREGDRERAAVAAEIATAWALVDIAASLSTLAESQ